MTRVLKRPMFRMGGSTNEGITSGLERPGYGYGKRVAKPEEISEYIETVKSMGGPQSEPLNDFLINFGLDLMSRSPSGNIFQTAAAAAKEPFGKFQERASGERSLNMNLAAKAMSELSDSDETDRRSTWMKKAQEAVALGMFPDTPEGLKAAYEDARLSSSDSSRSSDVDKIDSRTRLYIASGDGLEEAESKATFDVSIDPVLTETVGEQNGGKLPKGARARKKLLEKSTPGTYFYDLANGVVRKYGGMEEGVPIFIEVDQETYEDLPEDAAESNNIKTNLEKKKTGTTQEEFEKSNQQTQENIKQSISDTAGNIKDRFSFTGEMGGDNPYKEQVSLTDIAQKTRR